MSLCDPLSALKFHGGQGVLGGPGPGARGAAAREGGRRQVESQTGSVGAALWTCRRLGADGPDRH